MRADVEDVLKAAARGEAIPLTMSLGLFTVSCAAVRKFVVDHHRNLALEIPKVLARRVRAKGDALKEQFQEIARALHKKPTNVEEVAELEEYASRDSNRGEGAAPRLAPHRRYFPCRYVAGLNVPLAELQQGLKELVDDSAVLEGWEYLMPDEMSQAFWSTLAWCVPMLPHHHHLPPPPPPPPPHLHLSSPRRGKRIDELCKLVAEGNTALRVARGGDAGDTAAAALPLARPPPCPSSLV